MTWGPFVDFVVFVARLAHGAGVRAAKQTKSAPVAIDPLLL